MIEVYKEELKVLKYKMQKAEKFSKKLPIFSETILDRKLSGDEPWIQFGDGYKNLHCNWGINRGLFESGTNREVTNYSGKPYKEYLFCVYINTLTLYNSHEKFGLEKIQEGIPLFFYDIWNSTFYATDSQIEALLDALCAWYDNTKKQVIEHNKQEQIKELQKKLDKLQEDEL